VTFVRIYGAEGDTVFEGYAPGYQGTYVDPETNVAVYGTGYEYHSWTGTSWYGAPLTYGFGAALAYTPWTGWAVSFGNGWAWGGATLALGWGWGSYPWWGPWGWGFAWGPAFPWYPRWGAVGSRNAAGAWAPGGWAGYSGNLYQSWGNRAAAWRGTRGLDAWTGNAWASKAAVSYNSRTGAASAGQHGAVQNLYTGDFAAVTRGSAVAPQPRDPASGEWTKVVVSREAARTPDDLYAGADGDVYRRTEYGWERRTAEGWEPAGGGATAAFAAHDVSGAPVLVSVPGTEALERDREHRSMGDQRSAQLRESSIGMHQAFGGRVTGP
jgi:hypothetical protein